MRQTNDGKTNTVWLRSHEVPAAVRCIGTRMVARGSGEGQWEVFAYWVELEVYKVKIRRHQLHTSVNVLDTTELYA